MIVRMRESNVYASTRAYMNARRRALQEAMRWLNYYAYVTNTCAYMSVIHAASQDSSSA